MRGLITNMKLESQVCSLELAKRLKELGVKQNSIFYYQGTKDEIEREHGMILEFGKVLQHKEADFFSAFTVAEFGEMLPVKISANDVGEESTYGETWLTIEHSDGWWVSYENSNHQMLVEQCNAATEAEARAKMLVYLLENQLITI